MNSPMSFRLIRQSKEVTIQELGEGDMLSLTREVVQRWMLIRETDNQEELLNEVNVD